MSEVILFGGTFDPPHVGHLVMAELALEESGADELWFLPASVPPHKMNTRALPYDLRVRMTDAMVKGRKGMRVCTIEGDLPKPSYTVHTVSACKQAYPQHVFRFLIGSDSLASLPTWHQAKELVENIEFLVAVRSGYPFQAVYETALAALPGLRAKAIEMPLLDVSSTWLRQRFERGLPLCGLVLREVEEIWISATHGQVD
jgi:nicotinate-nucleotide adenylyltransferase